ncbi:hypothetical protein Q73_16580 [Bacillus coahuilensis m2-6]|uniref:EAL domain-containing protein n=1 Tax=Bacillus coahuilensis p1.1.43 TaxID=1150625 RepID=A0A147KCP2_9BACI|nr:EAL domain-containing protein [Bacillus coahuilensis]KUP03948.1 hypothetical protein Q73_16580 [Bacillus coahuilensis m2-6]KUP09430.1 hypothetical protein Q75_00465 [Bacillus coahuilensis p1.1.43]
MNVIATYQLTNAYQVIKHLQTNEIYGYESLLRGNKNPVELFDDAKKKGELIQLDQEARFLALRNYQSTHPLFINCHPDAFTHVLKYLDDFNTIETIVIELTEHVPIQTASLPSIIQQLRERGVKIAIDDFGKGYTNLELIEILRPDYLKLERCLIQRPTPRKKLLLRGISKLAKEVGTKVIMEGIETEEQLQITLESGIFLGQGFLLGKPHHSTLVHEISEF